MYFKNLFALAIAAAGIAAALEVKGYESSIKANPVKYTIGSVDIIKKCGKCAKAINECHEASNKTKNETCVKQIGHFAADCGGCAVNIPEYL